EEMNESAALFLEPYLLKQTGYTFTVKGIEAVESTGKDAYAVEIKSPKGRVFTSYYDAVSFLPVKSTKSQDAGPAGKMVVQTYFNEYKTVNNVKIPVKILLDQGQIKINFDVTDLKVNQGLKAEDIK
ncbi:MAG: insulinase family protein, partial [Sediminibacterium sp.]|nr:insulinase family protein [Sediminibacterium sp.]